MIDASEAPIRAAEAPITHVEVPLQLLNSVIEYLEARPLREVLPLWSGLRQEAELSVNKQREAQGRLGRLEA